MFPKPMVPPDEAGALYPNIINFDGVQMCYTADNTSFIEMMINVIIALPYLHLECFNGDTRSSANAPSLWMRARDFGTETWPVIWSEVRSTDARRPPKKGPMG